MSPPGQDAAVRAWAALLRVHAELVPAISDDVEHASGLPLRWYDVLLELAAAPGRRLTMSELGSRVVLSRSRASRIVDELEDAGLVAREENPRDRRSAYAALTPAGHKSLRQAAPHYLAAIKDRFAAALTDTQLRQVAVALEKVLLVSHVHAIGRRPGEDFEN